MRGAKRDLVSTYHMTINQLFTFVTGIRYCSAKVYKTEHDQKDVKSHHRTETELQTGYHVQTSRNRLQLENENQFLGKWL